MKTIKIISILLFTFMFTSCEKQNKKKEVIASNETKIEVIDFHSTHRCYTCNTIEENTKHTLDTHFSKEMKENKITFQVINIDEDKNFALAEKFEATGTSLYINVIKNGKERKFDLTDFAFSKARDKEVFTAELKETIEKELKNL